MSALMPQATVFGKCLGIVAMMRFCKSNNNCKKIIALQRKGLQFVLSTVAVVLMYAGLFYFDVYQWILGKDSLWGMGVAVLCLMAWVSTMGNAIKHDIEPKIDKLKKDRECLDDILRYRQYLLITKNNSANQDL